MITQELLNEFIVNIKAKYPRRIKTLKLEHVFDSDKDLNYVYLALIEIKKSQKCKGYGSAVVHDLLIYADYLGFQVKVLPTEIYGSNLKRLYEFYMKQGFSFNKNEKPLLTYYPQKRKLYQ